MYLQVAMRLANILSSTHSHGMADNRIVQREFDEKN
ncbi:MAG: hypothetical protein CLLPBCKN_003816 [Chroococcidiopsis cubana SAG 39.79]|nr:hypothetical protein [Chroococcidiopsis cubana SAG 39.79]